MQTVLPVSAKACLLLSELKNMSGHGQHISIFGIFMKRIHIFKLFGRYIVCSVQTVHGFLQKRVCRSVNVKICLVIRSVFQYLVFS